LYRKETTVTQVIYKIINLVNDKFYVGSTNNKKVRFRQHRKLLRGNRHHCKHLQAAWNKYGEDKFDFRVIEEVSTGISLQEVEDKYLQEHVGKPYCYNSGYASQAPWRNAPAHVTPNFGKAVSEEQKQAISTTLKAFYAENYYNHPRVGKLHSEETKAKISASKKGQNAGESHYRYGQVLSPEVRAKISATQAGRPSPRKGQKMSEQGRNNVKAAVKRGEESHFFGKRPVNADDLQRAIIATLPDRLVREFKSLTEMRNTLGVSIATIIRACKSGNPVKCGAIAGWVLSYKDAPQNVAPVIPPEYAHLPRSRQQAKEEGAKQYFTGIPCDRGHLSVRSTKGTCIECRREDDKLAYQKTKETACKKNV